MSELHYELRCRECGRNWGNQPRSICDDCFSPLEVTYDYDALKRELANLDEVNFRRAREPHGHGTAPHPPAHQEGATTVRREVKHPGGIFSRQ